MSSLPSGVRLVRLLNEHLNDIMNRERANQNSIHLYCTKYFPTERNTLGDVNK